MRGMFLERRQYLLVNPKLEPHAGQITEELDVIDARAASERFPFYKLDRYDVSRDFRRSGRSCLPDCFSRFRRQGVVRVQPEDPIARRVLE